MLSPAGNPAALAATPVGSIWYINGEWCRVDRHGHKDGLVTVYLVDVANKKRKHVSFAAALLVRHGTRKED